MKYRTEFVEMINSPEWQGMYIGEGNPNARVLIVGQESAIQQPDIEECSNDENWLFQLYKDNHKRWEANVNKETGFDEVVNWVNTIPRNNDIYNPLWPFRGQTFDWMRWHPQTGTSKTWYNYQKIVNSFAPAVARHEELSLFRHCFFTELNDYCFPNHKYISPEMRKQRKEHVAKRAQLIKDYDKGFFKSFDTVLLACGNYPELFNINIGEMFGTKNIIRVQQVSRISDAGLYSIGQDIEHIIQGNRIM